MLTQHTNELPLMPSYKIFRNEDFIQTFYFYQYSVDILSIVNLTITTKTPHFLSSGDKVVVAVKSPTLSYIAQRIATVTSDVAFTIVGQVYLPPAATIAAVLVPVDFSGSTFLGGIYNYLTQEKDISVNGTLKATTGNGLLTITGTKANLAKIAVGDRIRFGAMSSGTPILDISPVRITSDPALLSYGLNCENSFFEMTVLVLSSAVTETVTTSFFYVQRSEKNMQAGTLSRPIATSGNYPWGELTFKIESTALSTLQSAYPLQVLRSINGNEEMLLAGTVEII